jgi:acetoin utilization protein AcuB
MKPATDAGSRKRTSLPQTTTVRQVMTPAPHTIGTDQTLASAHALMRKHDLRHLPVLRGGRLVGVLSQRDLYFLETISGVDVDIDQVADAMSSDVYSVEPDVAVREVARIMALHKYGCTVVTENGRIMGIFTANDALQHLANLLPSG